MDDEFEIAEAIDLDDLLVEVLRGDRRREPARARRRWSSAVIEACRISEIVRASSMVRHRCRVRVCASWDGW
jgi:hypothetical protein